MQTIYIDISNKMVLPIIYAKQGDVGRKFAVSFSDSGIPYEPPNGSVFSVWYSGASGEGNYTDIGNHSAFSVTKNIVIVELISQMIEIPGTGNICLILSKADGSQIGSWNIPYDCEFVPGYESEEARNYYTAFANAVANLPYPDVSLSVPGKAADAAATGKALAGKAPAGYGLGFTEAFDFAEIDNIKANGWYACDVGSSGFTIFGIWFRFVHMRVDMWDFNSVRQTLYPVLGSNVILMRECFGNTWGEWECVNPPMTEGVEYRTIERYNGEPVYVKLINIGTLPNATIKRYYGVLFYNEVVDLRLCIKQENGQFRGVSVYGSSRASVWAEELSSIAVNTDSWDASDYLGYVLAKYTK